MNTIVRGSCPYGHGECTGAESIASGFDPLDESIRRNPFPHYRWLHQPEQGPVYRVPGEDNFYVVSGYEDIKAVLMDPWTYDGNPYPETEPLIMSIFKPDRHRVVRNVVQSMFTTQAIRQLTPRIEAIVGRYTDALLRQPRCDLMQVWAYPIPLNVIASMYGLPDDPAALHQLHVWGDAAVRLGIPLGGTGPRQYRPTLKQALLVTREAARLVPLLWKIYRLAGREGIEAMLEMRVQVTTMTPRLNFHAVESLHHVVALKVRLLQLFAEHQRQPGNDIIDLFIAANREQKAVSVLEMVAACMQILVAGYETTAASLGHAVHRLIAEPELFRQLKAEPARIPDFIDENLRLEAPLQRTLRRTTAPVTLGGVALPANANLLLILGAANRDARHFPAPDRFDIDRDNKGSDLTFGKGIHRCLGAQLNRIESEIALRVLLQRVEKIELDPRTGSIEYLTDKDIGMWALTRLPVVVTPAQT